MDITKIYLYNIDPLKPHFYIVKLGFTGVYIIFLISDFDIVSVGKVGVKFFERKTWHVFISIG